MISPERELNPKASFWREGREQISARGSVPTRPRLERSIPITSSAELQEIPTKEQMGFDSTHEEKRVGLDDWREDLRDRRASSSEEVAEERGEQRRRRRRQKMGGIMGGGGGRREKERWLGVCDRCEGASKRDEAV